MSSPDYESERKAIANALHGLDFDPWTESLPEQVEQLRVAHDQMVISYSEMVGIADRLRLDVDMLRWLHAEAVWQRGELLPLIDEREEWRKVVKGQGAEITAALAELIAKAMGHERFDDVADYEGAPLDDVVPGCDACAGPGWPCDTVLEAADAVLAAGFEKAATAIQRAGYVRLDDDAAVERVAQALAVRDDRGCFLRPLLGDDYDEPLEQNRRRHYRASARVALRALAGEFPYVGQYVEWNPTGDEWKQALVSVVREEHAEIVLPDARESLLVEIRHLRPALTNPTATEENPNA